jgi:predicted lysophospholipase L1 biosynthesis ABC-type transport system permease subunit
LGGLHVFIFFRLLEFARQLMTVRTVSGKQIFVIAFGIFVGITVFLLFQNLARHIQLLMVPDDEVYPRIVPIAQVTVTLLSFLLIATLLQNFIIFR